MSNSNSSREVTEKKKKDVWQEAGEEFYQESYPSGSGQVEESVIPRSSRSGIPLPSHTARKSSYGYQNRRRNTFGRTASVRTNTNAYTTYNSTTRFGLHEVQVSVLPDLADMTIPNERKRWNELLRIKSMPINMSAKRELKAQLTTIPMLKLKGTKRLKWKLQRIKESLFLKWRHRCRRHFLWEQSLRDVEEHSGTFIMGVFLSLKWTFYFNFLLLLLLNSFIVFPFLFLESAHGGNITPANEACQPNAAKDSGNETVLVEGEGSWGSKVVDCCRKEYGNRPESEVEGGEGENRWLALLHALNVSTEYWAFPAAFTYGFYEGEMLRLSPFFHGNYSLPLAYLLIPIIVFMASLIALISEVRRAVKEMALAREGEFYKFSNLIFAGWDHYTRSLIGAQFRKRILKNDMRISLEAEKVKVSTETSKEKWRIRALRFLTNILVFLIFTGIGSANYFITDLSLKHPSSIYCSSGLSECRHEISMKISNSSGSGAADLVRISGSSLIQLLPAISIALSNFLLLLILKQISRLESHLQETEKSLLLIRALIGRLVTIGSVALKYTLAFYCRKAERSCRVCENGEEKDPCWESKLGIEILIILGVDLILQSLLTLFFGYGRRVVGRILGMKRFAEQSFCITRHSLDIIYIQSLSWYFYFSPVLPLLILIYSALLFYLKKFTLSVLSTGVHESVRTTQRTAVTLLGRLIGLSVVILTFGLVLFEMEPSKGCGPFKTKAFPGEVLTELDHRLARGALSVVLSPRILIPLLLFISLISYFYYSSAKANRRMVDTLKHMLVLEGHDKQYLFARLNTVPEAAEGSTLLSRSLGNADTHPSNSAKNLGLQQN